MKIFLPALLLLLGATSRAAKPNIVILLADDLGIGDLGCYHPASKIPTLFINSILKHIL